MRSELVPVGGDEEGDAAGEEDATENEGDATLPGNAGGSALFCLVCADAGCGVGVEQTGGLPTF